MQSPEWVEALIGYIEASGVLVTAVATVLLWRVTGVLAKETRRLVAAGAQPHVVATLEPNRWSLQHFDLHVENTGNATAYDIAINFEPPLKNGRVRDGKGVPFSTVSVLKPGRKLTSYLSEFSAIEGKKFRVSISWKEKPTQDVRSEHVYTLDMGDLEGVTKLGEDPMTQIANEVKHLRDDWRPVASGSKYVRVDTRSQADRDREQQQMRDRFEASKKKDE